LFINDYIDGHQHETSPSSALLSCPLDLKAPSSPPGSFGSPDEIRSFIFSFALLSVIGLDFQIGGKKNFMQPFQKCAILVPPNADLLRMPANSGARGMILHREEYYHLHRRNNECERGGPWSPEPDERSPVRPRTLDADAGNAPQNRQYIRGVGTDKAGGKLVQKYASIRGTGLSQIVQSAYEFWLTTTNQTTMYISSVSVAARLPRDRSLA